MTAALSLPVRRRLTVAGWILAVAGVVSVVVAAATLRGCDTLGEPAPPRSISVIPVRDLGAEGVLREPVGIAVDETRVLVADAARREVVVFESSGETTRSIGAGTLRLPLYVAVDPRDRRVYVSDRELGTVVVFTPSGAVVGTVSPEPTGTASPVRWAPVGVGFAPDGTLYVSDVMPPQRLLEFSPGGSEPSEPASDAPAGPTGDVASYANGVAATADIVVVADSNNARLLILSRRTGEVSAMQTGGLPRGAAVIDVPGPDVFAVSDTMNDEVRFFDERGPELAVAGGSRADSAGRLSRPGGLAASSDGVLYVSDAGNRKVRAWDVEVGATARKTAGERLAWPWWLLGAGCSGIIASIGLLSFISARKRR